MCVAGGIAWGIARGIAWGIALKMAWRIIQGKAKGDSLGDSGGVSQRISPIDTRYSQGVGYEDIPGDSLANSLWN